MLAALRVQDFAVIESVELTLEPGLNVLSGETGAGKSIVVGALQLALGGRARSDIVRPGCRQALVEAVFDISSDEALCDKLRDSGIQCEGELVVRRIITARGRSRAYLNGRLCALNELQQLAPRLADITSQHESVALTDPSQQLHYLDHYAVAGPLREAVALSVDHIAQLDHQLETLREQERQRAEREAFIRYQLDTINNVDPRPDEFASLRQERARLRHANQLSQVTRDTARKLQADQGVCDQLARAAADLMQAAALDDSLSDMAHACESCWTQVQELATSVADYARSAHADPQRLEEVNERLFLLEGLVRQHGPTLAHVLAKRDDLQRQLDALDQLATTLPALEKKRAKRLRTAIKQARQLSRQRRRAAERLANTAQSFLRQLGMPTARVKITVSPRSNGVVRYTQKASAAPTSEPALALAAAATTTAAPPTSSAKTVADTTSKAVYLARDGIDQVQFQIATNRGMEPRALRRIASGGELSRVLLAMKRSLSEGAASAPAARCGVQVFDEVDAGIGGATADKVGQAVAAIAPHRQVLCITHLAAIAAYADAHFVVDKREGKKATATLIKRVEGKTRVAELARMLTGKQTAKTSLRAAREMLAAAHAINTVAA